MEIYLFIIANAGDKNNFFIFVETKILKCMISAGQQQIMVDRRSDKKFQRTQCDRCHWVYDENLRGTLPAKRCQLMTAASTFYATSPEN